MRILALTLTLLLAAFSTIINAEQNCSYQKWKGYDGVVLLRHPNGSAYIYSSDYVKVDADGAPNAYHPDDIGLHCTKGKGFKGLDCPANAGYPKSSWWQNALVPDPKNPNEAFVQQSGEFAGFFVSRTTLRDTAKLDADPSKYVDSTNIPYVVFPGRFYKMKGTGRMGDLGYAINLKTGAKCPFVVAEVGPESATLGEMSIALAKALGGNDPNPRTGEGIPEGTILYVVFPNSSRDYPWPLSLSNIKDYSASLLEKVGGVEGAMACSDAL
jgi:hypothetical protein